MKTTAGTEIPETNQHCDCGLTGGCEKCNPMFSKQKPKELDWENTFIFKYGYCSTDREKKIRENILEYIKELLTQQRAELLEEIKKLKKDEFHCCGTNEDGTSNCPSFCLGVEYNNALKDVINLLNKKDE